MLRKISALFLSCLMLSACGSSQPRIVEASRDMPVVHLTVGMATQIEMPDDEHVRSVVSGNPSLVTAEAAGNVVNLTPKDGTGETNVIVRSWNEYREFNVYQYRVIVDARQE